MSRKVVLYIAMSLDGFIAKENDDIAFLSIVEQTGEDYGYQDFINNIDTVIMGRRTYQKVLTFGIDFPHKGRKCYVISRTLTGKDENVEYYGGDLTALIKSLKQADGKDIFVDGGAELVCELMKLNLIDKYIVSVIPYFLGKGIRLFINGITEHRLKLNRCTTFPSGLVQLWYEKHV